MPHDTDNHVADSGRLAAIDMLMLDIVHDKFRRTVKEAISSLRFLRDNHLDALADAKEIPGSVRAVYADMAKRVVAMLGVLHAHVAYTVDDNTLPQYAASEGWRAGGYSEELPDIARIVERVNSAAADLRATIREVGHQLTTLPPAIVAWDKMAEVRMTVEFLPIRGRKCYDVDDDRDALEFVMRPRLYQNFLLDDDRLGGRDWNVFRFQDDHPLKNLHFDYITYCLIEHGPIPPRLLPLVKDVWFEVYVRGDGHASRNPNDEGPATKLPFGPAHG